MVLVFPVAGWAHLLVKHYPVVAFPTLEKVHALCRRVLQQQGSFIRSLRSLYDLTRLFFECLLRDRVLRNAFCRNGLGSGGLRKCLIHLNLRLLVVDDLLVPFQLLYQLLHALSAHKHLLQLVGCQLHVSNFD